jgi:alpha-1,6-mannosyltransferase
MSGVPGQDRLRFARYLGFVGAIALAVAAYLGGALPDSDLKADLARIWAQPAGPPTMALWLVGTALMVAAWWLAGRAGPYPARWLLVTTALWTLPLALAPPLASRDVYAYACQGAVYAAGLDPYAVGPAALPCPWLDSISMVWRQTPAPYGPLFVALAAAAVKIAGGNLWLVVALLRLAAVAGVMLTAVYLPRLARACGLDEARAAWLGLASPLVGVHLVSGAHNDALMIGFVVAGLVFAVRRRPLAAGVWFGVALAVKATAGVALPFAVLLVVRPERSVRRLAVAAGWVALGCAAAYAVIALATGLVLGWVAGLRHSGASVQWTSVPTGVGIAIGSLGRLFGAAGLEAGAIAVARTVGLAVLAVVLVTLWWRARGRDAAETVRYAGWALLAATALAPVFHPWYWLLPLVVLAAAGVQARWLVAATAALAFLVLPDGYNLARSSRLPGAFAALIAVLWLATTTIRDTVRRRSPVKSP